MKIHTAVQEKLNSGKSEAFEYPPSFCVGLWYPWWDWLLDVEELQFPSEECSPILLARDQILHCKIGQRRESVRDLLILIWNSKFFVKEFGE